MTESPGGRERVSSNEEGRRVSSYVEPQAGIDLHDTEQATYEIKAQEDVFSYLLMIGPTEGIKGKRWLTIDTCMAYTLVVLTLLFQGLVLYAVFNRVIGAKMDWEHGIVDTDANTHSTEGLGLLGDNAPRGCNTGESLCVQENGMFSCAPPTVKLTGRWDELDLNADGVWTRQEAEAAQETLQCKYVVDPTEVFDVFVNFVKRRSEFIWVHPDVAAGLAIPKAYFTYAAGDIIMCGYRSEKMCANLLERGFFNAPLAHNTVPRVGKTINAALDYCYELLRPGGTCEVELPSTYAVWKVASDTECQKKSYGKFVFTHPVSGEFKSLLSVDYMAVQRYRKISTPLFIVYKTVILGLWIMAMLYELKMMIMVFTWIGRWPAHAEGEPLAEEDEDGNFKIHSVTATHRTIVFFVTSMRLIMLCVLTMVGLALLLNSWDYMALIFDALALLFVLELGNMIYQQVLRKKVRNGAESIHPMTVSMYGFEWLNQRPGIIDFMWLLVTIGGAMAIMYAYYNDTVKPLRASIECACLNQGGQCVEAHRFDYNFWYDYWQVQTPQVFRDVAAMRQEQEVSFFSVLQHNVSLLSQVPVHGSRVRPHFSHD